MVAAYALGLEFGHFRVAWRRRVLALLNNLHFFVLRQGLASCGVLGYLVL